MADGSIWSDDLLDRKADAEFLRTFLVKKNEELSNKGEQKSFVLNIDSAWGEGKTFFVTRLREQLESEGHISIVVDAWKEDFADDPLVSVMAAIDEMVKKTSPKHNKLKKSWNIAKESAGPIAQTLGKGLVKKGLSLVFTASAVEAAENLVDAHYGDKTETDFFLSESHQKSIEAAIEKNIESIDAALNKKARSLIDDYNDLKKAIASFIKKLSYFIEIQSQSGFSLPMFVIIDELDRCRPTYAIQMLERVKHLFSLENVVFIISTDSAQLSHSIKAVYGMDFDSKKYLKRFFDKTFYFEEPERDLYIDFLLRDISEYSNKLASPRVPDGLSPLELSKKILSGSGLDLRGIKSVVDNLKSVTTVWDFQYKIEVILMVPILVGLYKGMELKEAAMEQRFFEQNGLDFTYNAYRNGAEILSSYAELANTLWQLGSGEFQKYGKNRRDFVDGSAAYYVDTTLYQEWGTRFGGIPGNQRAKSWICSYPKIARQAGRLATPELA